MDNNDLAIVVQEVLDLPLPICRKAVDAIVSSMKAAAKRGERIEVRGFGSFYGKKRSRGRVWSFSLKAVVPVPDRIRLWYRPGKAVLLAVNPDNYPNCTR